MQAEPVPAPTAPLAGLQRLAVRLYAAVVVVLLVLCVLSPARGVDLFGMSSILMPPALYAAALTAGALQLRRRPGHESAARWIHGLMVLHGIAGLAGAAGLALLVLDGPHGRDSPLETLVTGGLLAAAGAVLLAGPLALLLRRHVREHEVFVVSACVGSVLALLLALFGAVALSSLPSGID